MKKKRIPREVRVPVTRGLVDTVGKDLHFGILGLQHGDNSPDNWKLVGKGIFVVALAADGHDNLDRKLVCDVNNAVIALENISQREEATHIWRASKEEILVLCTGALAAEALLPHIDSRALSAGYRMFLALAVI